MRAADIGACAGGAGGSNVAAVKKTNEPHKAPSGFAKPWSGNYEAQRAWRSYVGEADSAAIAAGAGKIDLILAHLQAAADIKGVSVWELFDSLTPQERSAAEKF